MLGEGNVNKRTEFTNEELAVLFKYLDIIISESERLSELSMNVLNLSKIEQQSILTDKKRFNLSEQMKNCDVCRLALNDDGYPYILPLNFGMAVNGDKITLYFHSALEGYKVGLFQKDNRASFEMDCKHELQYFEDKGYCTMAYESVIGRGRIRILPDEEKLPALKLLMAHYHNGKDVPFSAAAIPRTLVYALKVESVTGKRKAVK